MANALPATMLLVEDNEMDVLIFKRALRKLGVVFQSRTVDCGFLWAPMSLSRALRASRTT